MKSPCHDILEMAKMESRGTYDIALAATLCKGFSGANDNAKEMKGQDGDLIKAAAAIINKARANNPILMENVKLHPRLKLMASGWCRL